MQNLIDYNYSPLSACSLIFDRQRSSPIKAMIFIALRMPSRSLKLRLAIDYANV